MIITIQVSDSDLAMIRQGLMCAASISRENGHNSQAMEFHGVHDRLPDPYFPVKPELHYWMDGEGEVTKRCDSDKDRFMCRACRVLHESREDAEDCLHDEKKRALIAMEYLKKTKEENWEYKCSALEYHYCK
jgi:hypothetical protein